MDFYGLENQDAVRLTWNNLPNSKASALKNVVPPALLYTPTKDIENLLLVDYEPLRCKCNSIISPLCVLDFRLKNWTCQFCQSRNQFPSHYASHISDQNLPAELIESYSTIEYISSKIESTPQVFLFIIDLCIDQKELDVVRDSLQQSLNLLPQGALELGYQEGSKCYAFNGEKNYTGVQIQDQLGINIRNDPRGACNNPNMRRFLLPLQDCEFTLNSILDDLTVDPWFVPSDERPKRATGMALNVGISLLEACQVVGSRIVSFFAGPCTIGNGQVVDIKLSKTIRTYFDIQKQNEMVGYLKKSQKYYQELATRAVKAQLVLDIFAFCLDQFGLYEMKTLSEKTGGYVVVQEEFDSDMFRESYKKFFEVDQNGDMKLAVAAKVEIWVSKEVKVQGAIGSCVSLKKNGPMVSDQVVGEGGTTLWYMGGMVKPLFKDRSSTLAIFLDITNASVTTNKTPPAFIQIQTTYKHANGSTRLRVTSITRKFADESIQDFSAGFDQEAACACMARLCVDKSDHEESLDILKWLDRSLIRLVQRFSSFKKEDAQSLRLGRDFSLFPQFMYHLRRSHFIQTFGSSPDESTFYRLNLLRENTTNSLVMIQPALLQYSFNEPQPVPVGLDIESLKPDVILLLDTYFQVVVWHGEKIHQWRELGYQEQTEYAHFKELLEQPMEDVNIIMEDRFPSPIYINTFQGSGKERYIKSKVNPSTMATQNTDSGNYITDDASLKVFMDHLVKLVVAQ